ncbi:apolipoprotein N-acyltransferase [bacterium]|nr:apolipoprotein N-acyltransferase [bacterium]MDB4089350.1 apolipoprotein N-acyltransferase [Flavobacteriales bacterium]
MLKRFALSISTGLILGLSWVEITGFFPLIFVALVPFLILEDEIFVKKLSTKKVYVHTFVIFAIFNLVSSWWIYHASSEGLVMAVVFGSILVAFPFWFFHLTRKFVGNKEGYIAFVINILAFEWIDYRWPLSHPWLPFGNMFSNSTNIVQWYEYTGVEGGTLWVLIINLLIFFGYRKLKSGVKLTQLKSHIIGLFLLIIIPISISYLIKSNVNLGLDNPSVSIVLSQPNIDPYKKFNGGNTGLDQVKNMLNVTKNSISDKTELIITPETAIPFSLEEDMIHYSDEVQIAQVFLRKYPNAKILSGASTHAFFDEINSEASREMKNGGGYWEGYNTSLLIDSTDNVEIYHKNKLVLGVETLPFKFITKPLESIFDLGGTSGSLGVSKEAKNFIVGKAKIAPTICYESIYGEYTTEFSRKGANVIAIITNDAWWYDTPGYKQLLAYSKLRAIENRKWIARSANTGISCFINPKGEIVKRTKWEEATSITMDVPLIEGETFYVRYGDYISRISVFVAALLLLLTLVRRFKKKTIKD